MKDIELLNELEVKIREMVSSLERERDKNTISLVESYAKEQNLWSNNDLIFSDTLKLDLSSIVSTISGPKRPQDKVLLSESAEAFEKVFKQNTGRSKYAEEKVEK